MASNQDPSTHSDKKRQITKCFQRPQIFHDLFKVIITCFIYMVFAIVSFYLVRHHISGKKINSVLDALYFTVVLMTSSGYVDLTPHSTLATVLTTLFAILGIIVTEVLLIIGAEVFLGTRPGLLKVIELVKKNQKEEYSSVMIIKYVVLAFFLVTHMAVGMPVLVSIGDMDFIHAFYCITSTITTVVGGDKCFSTKGGRVFALLWIVNGMLILSFVLYIFTELYTQRGDRLLARKALRKNPKLLEELLATAPHVDDGLRRDEYVLYRLREKKTKFLGKDMETIIQHVRYLIIEDPGYSTNAMRKSTFMRSKSGDQTSYMVEIVVDHRRNKSEGSFHDSSTGGNHDSWIKETKPSSSNREKKVSLLPNPCDLWIIIIGLFICLVLSTVFSYLVRHQISGEKTNDILDAAFFALVIMTSVGYGDLSPDDTLAILFASFFALLGTFIIGIGIAMVAQSLIKQDELLFKVMSNKQQTTPSVKDSKKASIRSFISRVPLVLFYFLLHMVVGTTILVSIEDLDFIRALYCISITITSAGNEKCFSTKDGRVFALFWIILGTIFKGYVLITFMELYTQRRQRLVVKRTIIPADEGRVAVRAEDIVGKLQQMWDFPEKELEALQKEFRKLNIDGTGILSLRDILSSYNGRV